ncbi:hypothetical protein IAQ61_001713 [Plenodomus lingam]|uniref:uncharacterized protein n=1 Tax=Leptosphaeria maculans TaxID=5022 RepID=UPI003319A3DA|nr:hypothetical protein IAQ61_001713 [Plenodomus lingam]
MNSRIVKQPGKRTTNLCRTKEQKQYTESTGFYSGRHTSAGAADSPDSGDNFSQHQKLVVSNSGSSFFSSMAADDIFNYI